MPDSSELTADLELAVKYATRAGLLGDRTLRSVEKVLSENDESDLYTLTHALNEVMAAISPITLADLKFGRDPFEPSNQAKSKKLQFWLTIFTLIVLALIGFFMHALRQEQNAIATLQEILNLRPLEKLVSLRKLAQWEKPLDTRFTLYDQYHEKVSEVLRIKDQIQNSYIEALEAVNIPLFPFGRAFPENVVAAFLPAQKESSASDSGASSMSAAQATQSTQPPATDVKGSPTMSNDNETVGRDLCQEDSEGRIRLPKDVVNYPDWIKRIFLDKASDFCFQVKVLLPNNQSALLDESFSGFASPFLSKLKNKVSLRVEWFLPFLYGLLGSTVFMMRNITSIRTPAIDWLPVLMRVSLGGVAGIAIGWFSVAAITQTQAIHAAVLPFGLAFVTGYSIDLLFSLLDKLTRTAR